MARVGIFAGTFDPVHNGHVAFALAAIEACRLNTVAFIPESQPRGKRGVTPFSHRVAMLNLVVQAQPRFTVLRLDEPQFTVHTTLHRLRGLFPRDSLTLLVGSDVAQGLPGWPGVELLYETMRIAVGLREGDPRPSMPVPVDILPTMQPAARASDIRSGLSRDIAPDVRDYIATHRLYGMAGA